jgi:Flagellar hook-length control protein FliK
VEKNGKNPAASTADPLASYISLSPVTQKRDSAPLRWSASGGEQVPGGSDGSAQQKAAPAEDGQEPDSGQTSDRMGMRYAYKDAAALALTGVWSAQKPTANPAANATQNDARSSGAGDGQDQQGAAQSPSAPAAISDGLSMALPAIQPGPALNPSRDDTQADLPATPSGENASPVAGVTENGHSSLLRRLAVGSFPQLPATEALESSSTESPQAGARALFSPTGPEDSEDSPMGTGRSNPALSTDNSSSTGTLAFTARLTPIPETASTAAPPVSAPSSATSPVNHSSSGAQTGRDSQDGSHAEAGQHASTQNPGSAQSDLTSADSTDSTPAPSASAAAISAQICPSPVQSAAPDATPRETRPLPQAEGNQVSAEQVTASNQPDTPAAPAREIQLQLNQGDQRVDVRLTERGGEVRVAVRTPDPQLADTLRDDLPHLSARLEQTGFRTETWHPALSDASSEVQRRMPATETSFSDPQQSGQNQARQGGQQQQQSPRQPKPNPAAAAQNPQRKEFAWLMSQLP